MSAAAFRALLENAIDYAGLFPPADLALAPALENQAGYTRSPDHWMLGAFILPVGKFEAVASHLAHFSADHPLQISALGPKCAEPANFRQTIRGLAAAIEHFQATHSGVIAVRQFEMPLPEGAKTESLGDLRAFWETPTDSAPATIAALAGTGAGVKLRTGGVTADAFPTDEQIARALVAAATYKVPIKFTAGLHHPVKHFRANVGTKMHGFLNVLGAGVLAAEHSWDEAQAAAMIADEDPASFVFDEETFRWRDWEITTPQIIARRQFVTSLGSCSFDEPRDDLRALDFF